MVMSPLAITALFITIGVDCSSFVSLYLKQKRANEIVVPLHLLNPPNTDGMSSAENP